MRRGSILIAFILGLTVRCLLCADETAGARLDVPARLQRLEQQHDQLTRQLQQLKKDLLTEKVERKLEAEQQKIRLRLGWDDGFLISSADKEFEFQVGGWVQTDGLLRLGHEDSATSTFKIRRAFLLTTGRLFNYYEWLIIVDFAGGKATLLEAQLNLHYIDEVQLQVGQQIVPFGMEELTSDRFVKLIERSMPGNFLNPGYDVGAMLHGKLAGRRIGYQVGIYNGAGMNRTDENDDKDIVGRLVLVPFAGSKSRWLKGLQLGAAASHGNQRASIGGSGPSTAAGTRFFSFLPGVSRDGARTRLGLEGAWAVGPFGLSAEYMTLDQHLSLPGTTSGSVRFSGWYVNASLLLTGEEMSFGRIVPSRPFDPLGKKSGPGAWELVGRISQLVAANEAASYISGARRATQIEAGINWWPQSTIRLSLNYQHAWFSSDISSEHSLMLRIQLDF